MASKQAFVTASRSSMLLKKSTSKNLRFSQRAGPIDVLRETSRTFYFSIINLPPGLREAVTSAYLSLRAIDEIEDHPRLGKPTKIKLLSDISSYCQSSDTGDTSGLKSLFEGYRDELPEVTRRLGDWLGISPKDVATNIWSANAEMARRMAYWVNNDWKIRTKTDLDSYTFSVAGAVGLLLTELWAWYDGTETNRLNAVGFGRGLQAVNILRNREHDLARGVDFFPGGWGEDELRFYAAENLALADEYVKALPRGPVLEFCRVPLALAYATLEALGRGETKLSRATVLEIVGVKELHSLRRGRFKS